MDKAVARVAAALAAGQRIAVFGDYDVDGSTSTALLSDFLTELGAAPRIYIPDRMTEGYGPSPAAMKVLHAEGMVLVVTVDCGAAAIAALEEAKALGMDVVVLDHHRVDRSPPAIAHVNPNQPADRSGLTYLCAAGVTFLFLVGLNRALRDSGFYGERNLAEPDLREHLDLVGLMMLLGKQQVNSIWVEAGPTLAGALLQAGLVDELIVYVAPKLLGHDARGLFVLPGLEKLADAPQLKFSEIRPVGPDVCLHLTTA
jgi:single-stranded-DNA-specific exonuclease